MINSMLIKETKNIARPIRKILILKEYLQKRNTNKNRFENSRLIINATIKTVSGLEVIIDKLSSVL